MKNVLRFCALAIALSVVVVASAIGASASPVETAAASGFGVRASIVLAGRPLVSIAPLPIVKVPTTEHQSSAAKSVVGPVRAPSDGSIIADLGVLTARGSRALAPRPTATGEGQVTHLALFEQNGTPQIAADLVHSVATATCTGTNKVSVGTAGSRLAGLTIAGQTYEAVPPANTTIPLVYTGDAADPSDDMGLLVILNEQHGAANGNGIRVTMIHVIAFSPTNPNLIFGDIQIATAQASVWCGPDVPATDDNGTERSITSDKVAVNNTNDLGIDVTTGGTKAFRSDTISWTITITNNGSLGCGIVTLTDTLPAHFTFVSSKGDLTSGVAPVRDGQALTWRNGARYDLPAGGKLVETVTATVDKDAPFGTYTNLVDIDESTCSSFTQGLRGPVEVVATPAAVLGTRTTLPTTGAGRPSLQLLGLVALGCAALGWTSLKVSAR